MARFIEGRDRDQATLFPERLDEAIEADNPVRVVDAFVDALDLAEIGFDVEKIKRVQFGPLKLDVEPGKYRSLTVREVAALKAAASSR